MSGIAGIFNLDGAPVDCNALDGIVDCLKPQGPDGDSVWTLGAVGLAHTLLQTALESDHEVQPCTLDGQVWITAEARIDARGELADALRAAGREPDLRRPDAELILNAYHAWGDECLQRLIGDFSFILWDGRHRRLLAARDHFGQRNLFYAHVGNVLVLSNSLESLFAHPAVSDELSEFGIGCFLALGSVNWIDRSLTAYHSARKLQPAQYLVVERGSVNVRHYWKCPLEVPLFKYRRKEEVLERFRELFALTIRDRLRAKRIVITLSGGMDSTSIAAMTMDTIRKQGSGPDIVALTQRHEKINRTDEAQLATLLAQRLDIPIQYLEMDDLPWLTPEYRPIDLKFSPHAAQNPPFQRAIASLAPVMFTGNSGDLLRVAKLSTALLAQGAISSLNSFVTAWNAHGIRPSLNFGIQRFRNRVTKQQAVYSRYYPAWIQPELESKYRFPELFLDNPNPTMPGSLNRRQPELHSWVARKDNGRFFNCHTRDNPVEVRDPFGDLRLLQFYLALVPLPWFANKYLAREAMAGLLPDEIRFRRRTAIDSGHHPPFLRDARSKWVDHWPASESLSHFVRRDLVPPLCGGSVPSYQSLANLRPLLLRLWLLTDKNRK